MARFYNCFAALMHFWYPENTRIIRTYESSYGNGLIQVVVHKNVQINKL
jgi:hypothetical protein